MFLVAKYVSYTDFMLADETVAHIAVQTCYRSPGPVCIPLQLSSHVRKSSIPWPAFSAVTPFHQ